MGRQTITPPCRQTAGEPDDPVDEFLRCGNNIRISKGFPQLLDIWQASDTIRTGKREKGSAVFTNSGARKRSDFYPTRQLAHLNVHHQYGYSGSVMIRVANIESR
jgi:hypothetical protein